MVTVEWIVLTACLALGDGGPSPSPSQGQVGRPSPRASGPDHWQGHTDRVLSVVYSPTGRYLLSAAQDRTIRLWSVTRGREICRLEGHTGLVRSVVFSADESRALSASYDGTMRLWDLGTGRQMRVFRGHTADVNAVA